MPQSTEHQGQAGLVRGGWGGVFGGGNSRVGEGSSSESIEGEGRGETNKDLCVQKLPTPQLSVFITPLL